MERAATTGSSSMSPEQDEIGSSRKVVLGWCSPNSATSAKRWRRPRDAESLFSDGTADPVPKRTEATVEGPGGRTLQVAKGAPQVIETSANAGTGEGVVRCGPPPPHAATRGSAFCRRGLRTERLAKPQLQPCAADRRRLTCRMHDQKASEPRSDLAGAGTGNCSARTTTPQPRIKPGPLANIGGFLDERF